MPDARSPWRAQFINLAHELRRQASTPAENFEETPNASIELKFHIDGVMFQLTHLAGADTATDRFLLQCHFGPLVTDYIDDALEQALSLNVSMARSNAGVFGVDESQSRLVYSCFVSLHGATPENVSEALRDIASLAHEWRSAHPLTIH